MTIAATTTRSAATQRPAARPAFGIRSLFAWLVRQDQSFRETRKLARMDEDRLKDMGLSRDQAARDFYQTRGNGPENNKPLPLHTGW